MTEWAWVPETCQFEVRDARGQLLESATLEFVMRAERYGDERQCQLARELLAMWKTKKPRGE